MDVKKFSWTRKPKTFEITDNSVTIISEPNTDIWQKTYYHFQNDNAPILQVKTNKQFFSFSVKTQFLDSHHRFDQCGIIMYLDSDNWVKASTEFEDLKYQHLGSVVTNGGYSDWATTTISSDIKTLWYRLSRRETDFRIESSFDGVHFSQMRIFHMNKGNEEVQFGIYACSPENSSFKAEFSDFLMMPCQWHAHDVQKPIKRNK